MKKRSVRIAGHPTSVSMEEEFWEALKELATAQEVSINDLISQIDAQRGNNNLSSAIRIFILQGLRQGRDSLDRTAGIRLID